MIEVLKQALEALEFFSDTSNSAMDKAVSEDAITSLRQAIAELESQEPMAWQLLGSAHFRKKIPKNADITAWNPLYHYPPKLEQKIVAWGVFEGNLHDMFFTQEEAQEMAKLKGSHAEVRPLYTHPPQRTEQEPVAWLLTEKNINSLQVDSIQLLIDRLKHAHHTDLCVRINGQDEWFQADWLKHMVRATPPQRKENT